MKKVKKLKTFSAEEPIGKAVVQKRQISGFDIQPELLGEAIKKVRLQKNLTQEELGKLVGVQKAQISKLENNFANSRFETVIKVFEALNAKLNFKIDLP